MKSQDLGMCKINNTKINNYSSSVRSFSMYYSSLVGIIIMGESMLSETLLGWIDWLMCELLNGIYQ